MLDKNLDLDIYDSSVVIFISRKKDETIPVIDLQLDRLPANADKLKKYIPLCVCNDPKVVTVIKGLLIHNMFYANRIRDFYKP